MRSIAIILSMFFFVGCQTSRLSHDEKALIEKSLQRRVTYDEARHICLDEFDRLIQRTQSRPDGDETRKELAAIKRARQRMASSLEAFLSKAPKGSELWFYEKGIKRISEDGFAFVKDGRVLDYRGHNIYD